MFNKKHNELLEKINKVDDRLSRLIRHLELAEKTVSSTPEHKMFITQKEFYEEQKAHLEEMRKIYDLQRGTRK